MALANLDRLEIADMSQATIEERVTRLEQLMDQLLQAKPRPRSLAGTTG
jgi:hypothetical protein